MKETPGFEVVEDVVLGHFSFAKYLMWKDLVDRTDQLRENGVVRHLITISNLIAHLLGKEKTVLFVSEKTAALEVVQRRRRAGSRT